MQLVDDNTQVNRGLCEVMIDEITKRYNDPIFQFSLVLLLFLLFYPFVRIIVYLLEGISWIILKLLLVTGVYTVVHGYEEVEDVV